MRVLLPAPRRKGSAADRASIPSVSSSPPSTRSRRDRKWPVVTMIAVLALLSVISAVLSLSPRTPRRPLARAAHPSSSASSTEGEGRATAATTTMGGRHSPVSSANPQAPSVVREGETATESSAVSARRSADGNGKAWMRGNAGTKDVTVPMEGVLLRDGSLWVEEEEEPRERGCSPGPVVIFALHQDEETMLGDWLSYHSWLFGSENIHVVDDNSQNPAVLRTLRAHEARGVHVLWVGQCNTGERSESGCLVQKDHLMTRVMRQQREACVGGRLTSGGVAQPRPGEQGGQRFLLPLDTDEFLLRTNPRLVNSAKPHDSLSIDPHQIRAEFEALQRAVERNGVQAPTSKRFKLSRFDSQGCCPDSLEAFLQDVTKESPTVRPLDCGGAARYANWTTHEARVSTMNLRGGVGVASKTFFLGETFIGTDLGNHVGIVAGEDQPPLQKLADLPKHYGLPALAIAHFGASSFRDWAEHAVIMAKKTRTHLRPKCLPRLPNHHYCVEFKLHETWQHGATETHRREALLLLYNTFLCQRCPSICARGQHLIKSGAIQALPHVQQRMVETMQRQAFGAKARRAHVVEWADLAVWLSTSAAAWS